MPYATIHYYMEVPSDGNFRSLSGASDKRLGVQRIDGAGQQAFNPTPNGARFALVETDSNLRYTVTPASLETGGAVTLPDGQSNTPGDNSASFAAAAYSMQGPITCEAGDVIRVLIA